MDKDKIRSEVYQIMDKPDWWFKSNNWKRMHGYPMLHHQKRAKTKAFRKKQFGLFKYMEELIGYRLKGIM